MFTVEVVGGSYERGTDSSTSLAAVIHFQFPCIIFTRIHNCPDTHSAHLTATFVAANKWYS